MVAEKKLFLFDSSLIIDTIAKSFYKTPLFLQNSEDITFYYAFLKDFLRLRQTLCISSCAIIIGKESYTTNTESSGLIEKLTSMLRNLGIPFINMPRISLFTICSKLESRFKVIVTKKESLLQLVDDDTSIIIQNDKAGYSHMTSDSVKAKHGVHPCNIHLLLALTKGSKSSTLTNKQALRLIEMYDNLEEIYKNVVNTTKNEVVIKLTDNKDIIIQRYKSFAISDDKDDFLVYPKKEFSLDIDTQPNHDLIRNMGFYSLVRLLKAPISMQPLILKNEQESNSYKLVNDLTRLKQLESYILKSKICAIDTESSDKDPHKALIFGISFSLKSGEAFYVPLIENDLNDLTLQKTLLRLKRILENTEVKFIGHNIKYDCLLLKRNGINIKSIYFDTMLAAYECFGDLDFFNLSSLSQRLLNKSIESYGELLKDNKTPWEIPLNDIMIHSCRDAETTLQLYDILLKELNDRGISDQFFQNTISETIALSELEFKGIQTDTEKLNNIRNKLLDRTINIKNNIHDKTGRVFDPDSQSEVIKYISIDLGVVELQQSKTLPISLLERLAVSYPTIRLLVKYKRLRKQINLLELVIKSIRGKRIYPIFNQISSKYGRILSVNPNIFEFENYTMIKNCFGKSIQHYFKNPIDSINNLESLSGDFYLKDDRANKLRSNIFMSSHYLLKNLDIDNDALLLSFVIGESDSKIAKQYLIDRLTITTIKHDIELRYKTMFQWIEEFKREASLKGYITIKDKRKFLSGLKGPNLDKRKKALALAIRWAIKY